MYKHCFFFFLQYFHPDCYRGNCFARIDEAAWS
jgi:hypothetical protein